MAKPRYTFGIADFVNAVYQAVFGKKVPDNFLDDRESYISGIEDGKITPEAFVENILISDYIKDKNLTDGEFLALCFKVMGVLKVSDKDWEFWMSKFSTRSRTGIVKGLTLTCYWTKFCNKYEVK